MWPFNRKKTPEADNIPPEVQEYYQSEQKQRVGIAWLLAMGTLLVTTALALGLFFGGRWVYRKIADKPAKPPTGQQQTPAQQQPSLLAPGTDQPAAPNPSPAPSTPASPPATPTPPIVTDNRVPGTGPADTLAIASAAAFGSTVLYQIALRRKQPKA